jgi:DNA polymerase-1
MATFLLVDSYNLIFRAFYGMPDLRRSDGMPTQALHGWMRMLWALEDMHHPDGILCFFDLGEPVRQLQIRSDYKAQRKETPADLIVQVPFIRELTTFLGWGPIETHGVEADDLIASCARRFSDEGHRVKIVSADKDLAQCLVYDQVTQLLPGAPGGGWHEIDAEGVVQKFGVNATQIADFLALTGDAVDNIPGIEGVGSKTAAKWLNQYRTIDQIIANSGAIKPTRFQSIIHASQSKIRENRKMTGLDFDQIVDTQSVKAPAYAAAIDLMQMLEMRKLASDAVKRYARDSGSKI